jgi:hypothetical protein
MTPEQIEQAQVEHIVDSLLFVGLGTTALILLGLFLTPASDEDENP